VYPLELVAEKIAQSDTITTLEAAERIGRRVMVAGVRQTTHRSRTAKGETILFLTLEDLHGMLDAILFPDAYRAAKSMVGSSTSLLVMGLMEMDSERGEPFIRVERFRKL